MVEKIVIFIIFFGSVAFAAAFISKWPLLELLDDEILVFFGVGFIAVQVLVDRLKQKGKHNDPGDSSPRGSSTGRSHGQK